MGHGCRWGGRGGPFFCSLFFDCGDAANEIGCDVQHESRRTQFAELARRPHSIRAPTLADEITVYAENESGVMCYVGTVSGCCWATIAWGGVAFFWAAFRKEQKWKRTAIAIKRAYLGVRFSVAPQWEFLLSALKGRVAT